MEVQQFADTILQWGPAGAAAVLILIAEKKIRSKWDSAKENDRKMCAWLYVGNWIFVMVLLSVVSVYWILDKNKANITMSGIVQDLRPPYKINDPTKELFTKTTLKNNWLQDVHWHYTEEHLPKLLEIRLENDTDFYDYQIPLSKLPDLMDIRIVYKDEKLWLKLGDKTEELKSIYSASSPLKISDSKDTFQFSLINSAFAGELVDNDLIFATLESSDSYMRQSASQYIVEHIELLLPLLEKKLASRNTSILSKTGIITALARASSPDVRKDKQWSLAEDTERQIFSFIFSDDKVLSNQSNRYIIRNISAKHLNWYESQCDFGKLSQIHLKQSCAVAGLNIIYNLAIKIWEESREKPFDIASQNVSEAINILDKGKELWKQASGGSQIQFAKLIYGKAFLYHELSKLDKNAGFQEAENLNKPKSVNAFKEMLSFLKQRDITQYQYPHHIQQANCYIEYQAQTCFDNYQAP